MSCFAEAIKFVETGLYYLDPKLHDASRNVTGKSVEIF